MPGSSPGMDGTTYNTDGSVYLKTKGAPLTWNALEESMTDYNSVGWPRFKTTNPLSHVKRTTSHSPLFFEHKYVSSGRTSNTGFQLCPRTGTPYSRDSLVESNTGLGAAAWKRFNPGKPEINSLQALVELKDLPRMANQLMEIRKKLKSFLSLRRDSSLYLGAEFGWRPLLSDLYTLGSFHRKVHGRLQQLHRDNGRRVLRGGPIRNNSISQQFAAQSAFTSPIFGPWKSESRSGTATRTDRVWCRIAFRYFIPDVGTSQWEKRAIAHLLGLRPNLSLVYELTPWSWAADWFVNTGDVLQNMSGNAAESLVADYSALMHETTYTHESSQSGQYYTGYPAKVPLRHASGSVIDTVVHKQRIGVMPYELGSSGSGLSLTTRQLAIAGALLLSKT